MSDNFLPLVLFWPSVGGAVNKRFTRNHKLPPTVARRPGQGVITGLAARKNAARFKGISPLNRPVQNRPARNRQIPNSAAVNQVWTMAHSTEQCGTVQYDSVPNNLIQFAFPLPTVLLPDRRGVCRKVAIDDKAQNELHLLFNHYRDIRASGKSRKD